MKLPNTFRTKKNLEKKTEQLIEEAYIHVKHIKLRYGIQLETIEPKLLPDIMPPIEKAVDKIYPKGKNTCEIYINIKKEKKDIIFSVYEYDRNHELTLKPQKYKLKL